MIGVILQGLWATFLYLRLALVLALLSAGFFLVWLFPFSDLSDFVTTKVSQATGNQVYVQFKTLSVGFLPGPSVSGTGVQLETQASPPLEAQWMKFAPSLLDIVANIGTVLSAARGNLEANQKLSSVIGMSMQAEGLLGGDVDLQLKPAGKNEQGAMRSKIYLDVKSLNLGEVQNLLDLPVKLSGQADLSSSLQAYANFEEQPEGDVELRAKALKMPASSVPTPMGPLSLPAIGFGEVVFKGRLSNGVLNIEEALLGKKGDPVRGRIKGQLGLRLEKRGPSVAPSIGAYDLKLDLEFSPAAEADFNLLLPLISGYRTQAPSGGTRYLMQVKASRPGYPPEMTQISTF